MNFATPMLWFWLKCLSLWCHCVVSVSALSLCLYFIFHAFFLPFAISCVSFSNHITLSQPQRAVPDASRLLEPSLNLREEVLQRSSLPVVGVEIYVLGNEHWTHGHVLHLWFNLFRIANSSSSPTDSRPDIDDVWEAQSTRMQVNR